VFFLCLVAACGDDGGDTSGTLISAGDGGEVTSTDGAFRLYVPPGALANDTRISVRVVPQSEWPAEASPVTGVYELEPDGLAFQTPAYVLHEFPTDAIRRDGRLLLPEHVMRASDGTIESTANSQMLVDGAITRIGAEVPHTSMHWIADDEGESNILYEAVVSVGIDAPLEEQYPIGAGPRTQSIEINTTRADLRSGTFRVRAMVPQDQTSLLPLEQAGWDVTPSLPFSVLQPQGLDLPWRSQFQEASRSGEFQISQSMPFDVTAPLPAWRCVGAGTGRAYASVFIQFAQFNRELAINVGETSCVADTAPGPLLTLAQPEGFQLFHVGANRPPGVLAMTLPGMAAGTYAAVASGSATGGLDLVHLESGARKTNQFVDVSPAYGVTAYQAANGARFVVHGGTGEAHVGWNDSAGDFGGTFLGSFENTPQVSHADFDDNGVAERIMVVGAIGGIHFIDEAALSIAPTGYAGGNPNSPFISAQFGRSADEILVAVSDGRLFFGPISGANGRLELVGTAGTSPRLMQCAGTTPRVCGIPDYAGDRLHVVEIDASGARIVANLPTGDAPIGPAVIADGATFRIAVTGSGDDSLEIFRYNPTSEQLTVDVARTTVAGCPDPNHVRWASVSEVIASCYGANHLVRLPQ
jgi:hypothetical protein